METSEITDQQQRRSKKGRRAWLDRLCKPPLLHLLLWLAPLLVRLVEPWIKLIRWLRELWDIWG
jgi:hypothetical protein